MAKTFDWYDQFRESLGGVDLEGSFNDLLKGLGQPVLVRSSDPNARCSCTTRWGEPDPNCPICGGTGFLYEDIPALCYMWQNGMVGSNQLYRNDYSRRTAYLVAGTYFKSIDQIVTVQLDDNGKVIWPVIPLKVFGVRTYEEKRADNKANVAFYQLEVSETREGDIVES